MSDKVTDAVVSVSFGETVSMGEKRLASSPVFTTLFREGMALVEETAAYLDGPGRRESKALERSAALSYATESMRLTTRLMQLASWLLLHRAVNEGEMSLAQASQEKNKVKLAADEINVTAARSLPRSLQDLITRSLRLQERVLRLDAAIHGGETSHEPQVNAVERQIGLLRAAFEVPAR